jgi:hypothetical protein
MRERPAPGSEGRRIPRLQLGRESTPAIVLASVLG